MTNDKQFIRVIQHCTTVCVTVQGQRDGYQYYYSIYCQTLGRFGGCQKLGRFGICRVLSRRGQLAKASAWVMRPQTSGVSTWISLEWCYIARMSAMVSLAYAHVHCYSTVDNPWTCYSHVWKKTIPPVSTHALWPLGVVTWWAINHVGVDSAQ